jgi:hypothetical protein
MKLKLKLFVYLILISVSSFSVAVDTDHDGLPDDWEIENGRNPNLADYQVSAGEFHTCAIDDDGVKCWSKIDPPTQFSINSDVGQIDVPPLENPFLLSAGSNRSCAVDDTGVVCWGRNTDSGNNAPSLLSPRELAVATDGASVCAIDDSGLVCWGDGNTYGQITPPDITNPRGLTAGNVHFCAIGDEGAQCWGGFFDNDYTDMSSLTNPSYISAGVGSTCAIDDSGVVCFGYINNWDIPTLSNPLIVEVGGTSACAIDDTGVHCWGTDAYSGSKLLEVPTLLNPHNLTINKTATLGYHHACSVTDEGVICWGHNQVGQVNVPVLSLDPDGDGYNNQGGLDTFPLDSIEWIDTDSDGVGNNRDIFPNDSSETLDTDSDGMGNNADTDDDGDGIADNRELGAELFSESANIYVAGDDSYEMYFNGQLIGSDNQWQTAENYVVSIRYGKNVIAVKGINNANGTHPGAFITSLITNDSEVLQTDSSWLLSRQYKDNWQGLEGSLEGSVAATEWGGVESYPWWDTSDKQDISNFPRNSSAKWIWSEGLQIHPIVYTRREFYFTDPLDSDTDDDGVNDNIDAFPLDATESIDTDSDGVGDNSDAFPNDASEALDNDSDGVGDNSDAFPNNALYKADSDSDGMPDAWEIRYGLNPNDASDATSDQDNDGVAALDEFLAGTIPAGSLDIDGNGQYDALTDGLLLLRGMFLLSGDSLISDAVASDAVYKTSDEVASRINMLGDLVDIDGNGSIDALTDGLVILRYLFNLRGDVLINDVIASDATVKTVEDVEAKIEQLIPAL